MDNSYLKLIESRINKAIAFIEELKGRERTLKQEREKLEGKIKILEEELKERDQKIEELLEVQKFLKDKIEIVLNKLESIELLKVSEESEESEAVTASFQEEKVVGPVDEEVENLKAESSTIIEEEFVDLASSDEEFPGKSSVKPTTSLDNNKEVPVLESEKADSIEESKVKSGDDRSAKEEIVEEKKLESKPEVLSEGNELFDSTENSNEEGSQLFEQPGAQSGSVQSPSVSMDEGNIRNEHPINKKKNEQKTLKMKSEWIWSNPFIDS